MEKRSFLIHGLGGRAYGGWRPWLRLELQREGFVVSVPQMPDPTAPKLQDWINELGATVGTPDENCYFVGHSLGCIAIFRYLESLPPGTKVGGAVLVAGFTKDLGISSIRPFFKTPIDWDKIAAACPKFVFIHSDDDPYVPLSEGDSLKQRLGGELIVKHAMGHFSGEEGTRKLPVVLESVLKISKKK